MWSLVGACASVVPPSCTFYNLLVTRLPGHDVRNLKSRLFPAQRCYFPAQRCYGGSRVPRLRGSHVVASNSGENLDSATFNPIRTTSESEKNELVAKLAAAEAEAEALKEELALRRVGADLANRKISTPDRRIDGTGYRERLFSGPGAKEEPKKWGITEAELFLSKGAPTEGIGLGGPAMEPGADVIITRRLVFGLGLTAAASGLAFIKLPVLLSKPSKPLFFYLTDIIRLKDQLDMLEQSASDASSLERQLRRASGTSEELKDTFLSAAALLDGADVDQALKLAFDIVEYLNQANYSKYFENLGEPTGTQQIEFLKFSIQSVKAACLKIQEFLALVPAESLQAAKLQLA